MIIIILGGLPTTSIIGKDTGILPVRTAEQAATLADQFLSRYYSMKRLLSVYLTQDCWRLIYDIRVLSPAQKVEVLLDANTGDVTSYGPVE